MDAGLHLRDLARDIRRLNDERNYRTHDDPQRRIDAEQARHALELARGVGQRVNTAIKSGRSVVAMPAPLVAAPANGRVPLHNRMPPASAVASARATAPVAVASAAPPASSTAQAISSPSTTHAGGNASRAATEEPFPNEVAEEDEASATEDTGVFSILSAPRRRPRLASGFARGLAAAALLIVGTGAGIGLSLSVAHGHVPGWLSFATRWYAPVASSSAPAAGLPLVPSTQARAVGALTASVPGCQVGQATIQLRNTGRTPLAWAISSPEGQGGATFALAPSGPLQADALGTVAPNGNVTVYAVGRAGVPYRVLVLAPEGAIQLVAPAC
ncbi:MAG: hypothetical protein IVW57_11575, partial [Ktedonobacterales bacterium]|nr:hypothetical protein [Ktedonobacterales bacterium]